MIKCALRVDGVLYSVTGWAGPLIPQGFTIDLRDYDDDDDDDVYVNCV